MTDAAGGSQLQRPGTMVVLGFALMISAVTLLLMRLVAHEQGSVTSFRAALFTATSAVCMTGWIVVDTPTRWSTFGVHHGGAAGQWAWAAALPAEDVQQDAGGSHVCGQSTCGSCGAM